MRQLYRRPVRITGLQMDSLSLKVRQQSVELFIRYRRHGLPA
jgi:hypothetical protein